MESISEAEETRSGGVSTLAKAFDWHDKASIVMEIFPVMVIEEVESLTSRKALQAMLGVSVFVEDVPAAIESIGPSTIVSWVPPTRALAPRWVARVLSLSLMDSMKAKELLLGATPPADVMVL